jgi:ADP-ribosyl-[dinitrogen reductase] hydrolase
LTVKSGVNIYENAFLGSLVADALAMPVHWYYDRAALQRDYGQINGYLKPKNPHADSILWRSQFQPLNAQAEILHEQARYWGQRGIHYHQFLAAGENTLNYQLAIELHRQVKAAGGYNAEAWLERYIVCLRTPQWHHDTYLEEYHRAFFNRLASGLPANRCGIEDEHIGGLAQVPALLAALNPETDLVTRRGLVREHVSLTHRQAEVLNAADILTRLLDAIGRGIPPREALAGEAGDFFSTRQAEDWQALRDEVVVGTKVSPACYIKDAMRASLYLAWKYHQDFSAGVIANAQVGGDNCHRGAVVGSLLGAALGVPDSWRQGLLYQGN